MTPAYLPLQPRWSGTAMLSANAVSVSGSQFHIDAKTKPGWLAGFEKLKSGVRLAA